MTTYAIDPRHLGVLLVGFGGPESIEEVPAFVERVLGRSPGEPVIDSAIRRYTAIGGSSPLPATTRRQAQLLKDELSGRGVEAGVYVGMLHARPGVTEAAAQIAADRVTDVISISLAPYRCEVSTDAYEKAAAKALAGSGVRLTFASDWNLEPGYIESLSEMLDKTMSEAPARSPVIFSAHSLPMRMIEQGDPYADQLAATSQKVAESLGLEEWYLAYQSISAAAREPWLGPSIEQIMETLASNGAASVVVDPIGFVSDHVETLFDSDVEHRARAEELGLAFHRCRCLNDHPGLIRTFADLVTAV